MIPKRWRKVKEAWYKWVCIDMWWSEGFYAPMPAEYIPTVILPATSHQTPTRHPIIQYCWSTLRFKSLT